MVGVRPSGDAVSDSRRVMLPFFFAVPEMLRVPQTRDSVRSVPFSDAEHNAGRKANGACGISIRAEAEVFQLRPQRESSPAVEPNVGSCAGAECKRVGRVGKTCCHRRRMLPADQDLRKRNKPVPLTV